MASTANTATSISNNSNNSAAAAVSTNESSKLFHTYENVCYDEEPNSNLNSNYAIPTTNSPSSAAGKLPANMSTSNVVGVNGPSGTMSIAVNKSAIDSPFGGNQGVHEPVPSSAITSNITPNPVATSSVAATSVTNNNNSAKILSTTDSSGTTRMLTSQAPPGQNLVTKLITFSPQSPMDSLKEWSVSTFKCTKQLINERRGICPVTNDSQLRNDIEQLRENRNKLLQMLRYGRQLTNHYTQLVRTQKQLHALMNEMAIKCYSTQNNHNLHTINSNHPNSNNHSGTYTTSKQVVANFSSLGNNLSSTTTTSPTRHRNSKSTYSEHNLEDFLPVLNYMRSSQPNLNLVDDFKKNAMTINVAIKNGEKLLAALDFYCSNLATLIDKTIEDTLNTVKQYESARLEYDAEKNSLNYISPAAQTSITYSSDKLELARMRYEQLKEDVQIKMRFLEENTIKVMHKQLLIFNGAFASYTSGNTAALDATLKQFSIRDTSQ